MNESMDTRKTVQDNTVVSLDYTLTVDGGIVDQSDENEPIQFLQGHGQIIPGLEKQLYGMSIGESKKVVVPPAEGYGDADEDAFADIPRNEFPPQIPLEEGVALQLRDQSGEVIDAYIVDVKMDTVRLSFNHPLAGKELHFSVTVTDLRDATEDELAHGHVHGEGDEFDDEDEWEEEEWDEDEDGKLN